MDSEKDQFGELRATQSPHDPGKLEACPECGSASIMGKDHWDRVVRMHRVDRGNGYYGYDVAKHDDVKP